MPKRAERGPPTMPCPFASLQWLTDPPTSLIYHHFFLSFCLEYKKRLVMTKKHTTNSSSHWCCNLVLWWWCQCNRSCKWLRLFWTKSESTMDHSDNIRLLLLKAKLSLVIQIAPAVRINEFWRSYGFNQHTSHKNQLLTREFFFDRTPQKLHATSRSR